MDRDQLEAQFLLRSQLTPEAIIRAAWADPARSEGNDLCAVLQARGYLNSAQSDWVRRHVYEAFRQQHVTSGPMTPTNNEPNSPIVATSLNVLKPEADMFADIRASIAKQPGAISAPPPALPPPQAPRPAPRAPLSPDDAILAEIRADIARKTPQPPAVRPPNTATPAKPRPAAPAGVKPAVPVKKTGASGRSKTAKAPEPAAKSSAPKKAGPAAPAKGPKPEAAKPPAPKPPASKDAASLRDKAPKKRKREA